MYDAIPFDLAANLFRGGCFWKNSRQVSNQAWCRLFSSIRSIVSLLAPQIMLPDAFPRLNVSCTAHVDTRRSIYDWDVSLILVNRTQDIWSIPGYWTRLLLSQNAVCKFQGWTECFIPRPSDGQLIVQMGYVLRYKCELERLHQVFTLQLILKHWNAELQIVLFPNGLFTKSSDSFICSVVLIKQRSCGKPVSKRLLIIVSSLQKLIPSDAVYSGGNGIWRSLECNTVHNTKREINWAH